MFINANDLVEIKIYYKREKFKYLALTEAEITARIKKKQLGEEEVAKDFKTLIVKMSVLTWGAYNSFQDAATLTNEKGERYFDYRTYKEQRLQSLLKFWDAKDDNGKDVTINRQSILMLAPSIGDAIVRGFDESSYYDEEEEKK